MHNGVNCIFYEIVSNNDELMCTTSRSIIATNVNFNRSFMSVDNCSITTVYQYLKTFCPQKSSIGTICNNIYM